MIFKLPSNANHSMNLSFYDSLIADLSNKPTLNLSFGQIVDCGSVVLMDAAISIALWQEPGAQMTFCTDKRNEIHTSYMFLHTNDAAGC